MVTCCSSKIKINSTAHPLVLLVVPVSMVTARVRKPETIKRGRRGRWKASERN